MKNVKISKKHQKIAKSVEGSDRSSKLQPELDTAPISFMSMVVPCP